MYSQRLCLFAYNQAINIKSKYDTWAFLESKILLIIACIINLPLLLFLLLSSIAPKKFVY